MSLRTMFKAAALVALLATSAAQATPLLTNGSFEANAQANGSWGIYPSLAGWSAAPNVELRNNVAGAAQNGVNYVELDGYGNGAIFQNVGTNAGQSYLVSFWYSPRSGVAANSNAISFAWGGNTIASVTGNGSGSGNVWQQFSYNVLATGALTELRFSAGGISDGYGGSLDNVSVSAIPEPAGVALFALALGMLGFAARRKNG